MPIDYHIERDLRIVVARATATLDRESLIDHIRAIATDDRVPRGAGEILQLNGASSCDATVPDLYAVAETFRGHGSPLKRLALVCEDGAVLPRLLLLQEFTKGMPLEIGVFAQTPSAAAWLHVRAEEIGQTASAVRG